jgi:acyl carrier protein
MTDVAPELKNIICTLLGPRIDPSDVTPETNLAQIGVDSLLLVELLITVEESFEVEFPDDLLVPETFETPASLWNVVTSLRVTT